MFFQIECTNILFIERKTIRDDVQRIEPGRMGGTSELDDLFAIERINPDAILKTYETEVLQSCTESVT